MFLEIKAASVWSLPSAWQW